MMRDKEQLGITLGMCSGLTIAFVICLSVAFINAQVFENEKDLLRFCIAHSIPLEQCKIPEEVE